MHSTLNEVRYAFRSLARAPVFAITVVLVLALGIAANIVIFTVVNAALLRPLPYAEPDRLVRVFETFPLADGSSGEGSVSYPNYRDWLERTRSFASLAIADWPESRTVQGGEQPERQLVVAVGETLFETLGVPPLMGTTLTAGPGGFSDDRVAVIGEGVWRQRFGGNPGVLGSDLILDGERYRIVGVMPARFRFPMESTAAVWVPFTPSAGQAAARGSHAFQVVGRLAPGVALETASSEMRSIAADIERENPAQQEGRSAQVTPVREVMVGQARTILLLILGAAGLVLLIACGNVAALLMARSTTQRREVAIRSALGAGRRRVALQYLAQSAILAAVAGLTGLLAATGVLSAFGHLGEGMVPRFEEATIDLRVVAFLLGLTTLTALIFGLLPATSAARLDLQRTLREGGRTAGGGGGADAARGLLVVAQVALSLVLLVGTGLLLRTFVSLTSTDTGFQVENVLTMRLGYSPGAAPGNGAEAVRRYYGSVLDEVRALPGVREAGLISHLPLQRSGFNGNVGIAGQVYDSVRDMPFAELRSVSPGYFGTMGIPLVLGRDVDVSDGADAAPVAVVNRAFAERYLAGAEAVGEQLLLGGDPVTIVGVVGDVRQVRLDRPAQPEIYFPHAQFPRADMTLALSGNVPPDRLTGPVRAAVLGVDPRHAISDVQPMREVLTRSISDRRLYLLLAGGFALAALVLVSVAIYGTIAYGVAQRRREMGIRLALGCEPATLRRLVVWGGGRLALLGVALGLPMALILARLLEAQLFGVSTGDPATYLVVAALLVAVAFGASYLPGRRAAAVDPIAALRAE